MYSLWKKANMDTLCGDAVMASMYHRLTFVRIMDGIFWGAGYNLIHQVGMLKKGVNLRQGYGRQASGVFCRREA